MAEINGKLEKGENIEQNYYREIITKAVCGSGQQNFRYVEYLSVPAGRIPSSILGSSITRYRLTEPLKAEISPSGKKTVRVSGTFDINVWYSYNNDQATDVAKETVKFTEIIPIDDISEGIIGPMDARAILTKAPQCIRTLASGQNQIKVEIEMELYAEIIGETKVYVQVYPTPGNSAARIY
ncbi:outer spore coat protein CotE [Thermincola ferriacetica]